MEVSDRNRMMLFFPYILYVVYTSLFLFIQNLLNGDSTA